jgi:hypothetical protein
VLDVSEQSHDSGHVAVVDRRLQSANGRVSCAFAQGALQGMFASMVTQLLGAVPPPVWH